MRTRADDPISPSLSRALHCVKEDRDIISLTSKVPRAMAHAARLMCEGDTVLLECKSNPHVVDIKFTQLKRGQIAHIAKGKVTCTLSHA